MTPTQRDELLYICDRILNCGGLATRIQMDTVASALTELLTRPEAQGETPTTWVVFCAICKTEWTVPHQHPGKSICESCERKALSQPTSDEGSPKTTRDVLVDDLIAAKTPKHSETPLTDAAKQMFDGTADCFVKGVWYVPAYKMAELERTLHAKERELAAAKDLVQHCWIHSGYPNCGYTQMTNEQKLLFDHIRREQSVSAAPQGEADDSLSFEKVWESDEISGLHVNNKRGAKMYFDAGVAFATTTAPQSGKKEDGPQLPEFDDLPDDVREEMEMVLYTTVSDEDHFGSEVAERIYGIVREVMLKRRLLLRQEWVKNVTSSDEDEPSVLGVPTPSSPPSKAEGET